MHNAVLTGTDGLEQLEANTLLKAISRAQEHLITNAEPEKLFDGLLSDFLELTNSEYGFIAELLHDADGQPFIKTHAISNIAWDDETRTLYNANAPKGLKFYNLKSLYGEVVTTGKPVIANDPGNDPRQGGLPEGHPVLKAFLGVPVYYGERLAGMIGVANCPGGYDQATVDYLQPLLKTYGQIIEVYKTKKKYAQSVKKLEESEERFRTYIENTSDALFQGGEKIYSRLAEVIHDDYFFYAHDTNGFFTYLSPSIKNVLGYSTEEFSAHLTEFYNNKLEHNSDLFETNTPQQPYEIEVCHKDGDIHQLEITEFPILDENDRVIAIEGIAHDITERKLSEKALIKMNRTLSTILKIDHAMVRSRSEDELLNAVCDVLVTVGGHKMAWVGFAENDKDKSVKSVAKAGDDHGYIDSINISWGDNKLGHGPTGTAIRGGVPVAARDIHNDPDYKPWREVAERHGYSSSIALPLINKGETLGALNIYSTEPDAFDTLEVELLKKLTNELAYGIWALRESDKRKIAEQTVHKQMQRLNALERISRLSLKTNLDDMLGSVLEEILSIFQCDRAWFLFPCNPDAPSWRVPMERTRPEWPGANAAGIDIPMTTETSRALKAALETKGVIKYGPESGNAVPDSARNFSVQSQMSTALRVKTGDTWLMGIHHCAQPHVFTEEEESLYYDIAQRVTDALSSLLAIADLSKSQASLAEAQRIAKFGNWGLDLTKNELTWSDEIYRIFGLDPQGFGASYETFLNAVHPDDRDYVNKSYTDSIENKKPYDIVHRLLLKDGTLKYVNEKCETHYDANGKPLRSIGTVQDITERVIADEKLRQLAAVVQNTAEAVIVTNEDNKIIAVNSAFTDITGYTEEEALGNNPRLLKSEKHNRSFYNAMWSSIKTAGYWQGEIWDRRKNGEIFPAWSTVSAVRDDAGNLINYVSVFSDISTLRHSQEQLDFLAHHDPLTNLPNRLLFNDRLEHAIQRAQRENYQISILFLDLDRFKNVNDSLGHPIGDTLLKDAAIRISNVVRKEDTVARLGGDEFIVLIEDVGDAQDAAQLAQKVIKAFVDPFSIKGHELHLTVSVGISMYPRDGDDGETLVRNADAAMYRAKEEGRNNYQFYTAALTTAVFERLTLENALRQALDKNELVLYYQPQYQLETGRLIGAEALIRWKHPELGLISPARFIHLAEDSGLIEPIGKWVLQAACSQVQQWSNNNLFLNRVSVNVSGLQFQRGDIVETVDNALSESGLDPKRLELEITESFIMQKADWAIGVLDKLKQLGVRMAIDDFGTGYSSLSYLKRLPVDKLKIDRSFVRDIPLDPNDEAITRAIVALGHSLQLEVNAEGVETEEQRAFLESLGCDEGQGFLYSQPVSAKDFEEILRLESNQASQ